MSEPVLVLMIGSGVLAALSFILARLIPDDYDRVVLRPALSRRAVRRNHL